jgi:glycerol kinase
MSKYLLAIDQGTTGSTALVVSLDGQTLGRATTEFPQHFPKPGWVEHDAKEIWRSVEDSVKGALKGAGVKDADIAAIGITNQRETTLLWDKKTRAPIHNAIVWQCRRTADACDALKKRGLGPKIQEKTGLVLDAYFSGTKIAWLLDNVPGARARADKGELAFGTIDAFVVSQLTSGDVHATDVTNASRTLLMNLARGEWDPEMCETFRVPSSVLPKIVGSAEVIGTTRGAGFLRDGIPIAGIAGDQQAALFGQACFKEGDAKCTYGTGAFVLMNIGDRPILSSHGLVTTAAWKLGGKITYALEGSSFIAGAAVQWLRDGLGIIKSAEEIESLARKVESSDGVCFVPALAGLGAPYWDQGARGLVCGITRGTTAAHLARATLEGIGLQVFDLLDAMAKDAKRPIATLRVDGGACRNDLLMQFQSCIGRVTVERPTEIESTGRGAAMLAGVGAGLFSPGAKGETSDKNPLVALAAAAKMLSVQKRFEPTMAADVRDRHLDQWKDAVRRTRSA